MKSTFGKNLTVTVWGGSHEPEIGVDITGIPAGTTIDTDKLQQFLNRRMPGSSPFATKRKESDIPVPTGGLEYQDSSRRFLTAAGSTISFKIQNTDRRSADYKALSSIPRPGHADFTARVRYGSGLNMAGGGPFSARMTAPMCIAGGIAIQLLQERGIQIGAHILSIGGIKDEAFDPVNVNTRRLAALREKKLAVLSEEAQAAMEEKIYEAMSKADSLGGVVEVCALGLPAGIGGAMYDGLESSLAPIFFGIPAVKGVEFGAGFKAAELTGSVNNDAFYFDKGTVKTRTNNHGGILGGITTGMPLIARIAFKPTPSIGIEQDSVDLDSKINTRLTVKGRHDPCVAVRAVPITEAALALGILDSIMQQP